MKRENKILVVDDEAHMQDFLTYNLQKNGFRVFTATNGHEAVTLAGDIIPEIILLDIMMPGMDGIETCLELRKNNRLNDTLIAFLTARGEDYTQIAGFEAGADDFIKKPVRMSTLLPRLKALLSRSLQFKEGRMLEVGDLKILVDQFQVFMQGQPVILTRKEFEVLVLLASYPQKTFTLHEIFVSVWGESRGVMDKTVNVHISRLRKKLSPELILSLGGTGYRMA